MEMLENESFAGIFGDRGWRELTAVNDCASSM
jgi:hypothetical protein